MQCIDKISGQSALCSADSELLSGYLIVKERYPENYLHNEGRASAGSLRLLAQRGM